MRAWVAVLPLACAILSGCAGGRSHRISETRDTSPTAGSTGQTVDYTCIDDRRLRITFLGDRAVADTGYDQYRLRRSGEGDDVYDADGQASDIELRADTESASLRLGDGDGFEHCIARG